MLYWLDVLAFVLILIIVLLDYFLFSYRNASNVLDALFCHFNRRNEKLTELRSSESKAKQNVRVFEVKTINQNYYRVVFKHLEVVSTEQIASFSITEENSYLRGMIHPVLLNQFEVSVKDTNVRLQLYLHDYAVKKSACIDALERPILPFLDQRRHMIVGGTSKP